MAANGPRKKTALENCTCSTAPNSTDATTAQNHTGNAMNTYVSLNWKVTCQDTGTWWLITQLFSLSQSGATLLKRTNSKDSFLEVLLTHGTLKSSVRSATFKLTSASSTTPKAQESMLAPWEHWSLLTEQESSILWAEVLRINSAKTSGPTKKDTVDAASFASVKRFSSQEN